MLIVFVLQKNICVNSAWRSDQTCEERKVWSEKQAVLWWIETILWTAWSESMKSKILLKIVQMIFERRSNQSWIDRERKKEAKVHACICSATYTISRYKTRWTWNQNHIQERWSRCFQKYIQRHDQRSWKNDRWRWIRSEIIASEDQRVEKRIFYFQSL